MGHDERNLLAGAPRARVGADDAEDDNFDGLDAGDSGEARADVDILGDRGLDDLIGAGFPQGK